MECGGFLLDFFTNYVIAQLDTFVTDKNRRPCDQLAYFMLTFSTKGAIEKFFVITLIVFVVTHILPRWFGVGLPSLQ